MDLKTTEGQEVFVDLMLEHLRRKEKTGIKSFDDIIEIIKYYIEELRRKLKVANVLTPEVKEYLDSLLSDPDVEAAPEWNNYFKGEGGLFAGAESADSGSVDEKKEAEYKEFVKDAWKMAINLKEGEVIPNKQIDIALDENGYKHKAKATFFRHIYKEHVDEKTERKRGQTAIKENDFYVIPKILENPAFVVKKIIWNDQKRTLFAKHIDRKTYVYIVQTSNKKHQHFGVTFFKLNKQKRVTDVLKILENNKGYNLSEIEVKDEASSGGNPTDATLTKQRSAVAKPANLARNTSLSTQSPEKSSDLTIPSGRAH
ncbi:MAG: hypothetical protein Ta2B_08690 [Termitinemataceae bacterium]|nr:MAG: hypothetical protein Ta2B_08690 [Termitinemataceae bacterium]